MQQLRVDQLHCQGIRERIRQEAGEIDRHTRQPTGRERPAFIKAATLE